MSTAEIKQMIIDQPEGDQKDIKLKENFIKNFEKPENRVKLSNAVKENFKGLNDNEKNIMKTGIEKTIQSVDFQNKFEKVVQIPRIERLKKGSLSSEQRGMVALLYLYGGLAKGEKSNPEDVVNIYNRIKFSDVPKPIEPTKVEIKTKKVEDVKITEDVTTRVKADDIKTTEDVTTRVKADDIKTTEDVTTRVKTDDIKTTEDVTTRVKTDDIKTTEDVTTRVKTDDIKTTEDVTTRVKADDIKITEDVTTRVKADDIKTTEDVTTRVKADDIKTTEDVTTRVKADDIKTTEDVTTNEDKIELKDFQKSLEKGFKDLGYKMTINGDGNLNFKLRNKEEMGINGQSKDQSMARSKAGLNLSSKIMNILKTNEITLNNDINSKGKAYFNGDKYTYRIEELEINKSLLNKINKSS